MRCEPSVRHPAYSARIAQPKEARATQTHAVTFTIDDKQYTKTVRAGQSEGVRYLTLSQTCVV